MSNFFFFSGGRYTRLLGIKRRMKEKIIRDTRMLLLLLPAVNWGRGGYVFCNNTSSIAAQTIQVRYRNRTNKAKRVGGNEGGQKIKIDYPVNVCVCVCVCV